jgi:hypothetical protein
LKGADTEKIGLVLGRLDMVSREAAKHAKRY